MFILLIFYVLQPQDQDVDVSPQVGLAAEITESQAEEDREPEGPTMKDIFMEIKKITEKGPKSVLMEVIFKIVNHYNIKFKILKVI